MAVIMRIGTNCVLRVSVAVVLMGVLSGAAQEIQLTNPSFEQAGAGVSVTQWDQIDGWRCASGGNSGVSNDEYYSPVNGRCYAYQGGGGAPICQKTDHRISSGRSYTLRLWARSINQADNSARTTVEARLYHDDVTIAAVSVNVNALQLKGAAASTPNDDGANVWIDGGYRHQFSDVHMVQPLTADPIADAWTVVADSGYEAIRGLGWAVGPVIAGPHRYIYGTRYRDRPSSFFSSIPMTKVLVSKGQDYTWSDPVTLICHTGTEFPWVEDPHCYYDEDTGRLWMSWGGGICYVSELDPATGLFVNHQSDPEYDAHPQGMHVPAATWPETRPGWDGDRYSNAWMEGAALYKYNGHWFYFGSYGHLGKNYTIRYGRGANPTGPFFDKEGVDMMAFDETRNAYGNTILLGDEGEQRVPGHPHLWEEYGKFYMGYDFRKQPGREMDYMGIRRLFWVDGWPTIWTPITVNFKADDFPAAIGRRLGVSFRNAGHEDSRMAVDHVTMQVSGDTEVEAKPSS